MEIYYKELAHTSMDTEKPHSLQAGASGMIQSTSEGLRTREVDGVNPVRGQEKRRKDVSARTGRQEKRVNASFLHSCSIQTLT